MTGSLDEVDAHASEDIGKSTSAASCEGSWHGDFIF